MGKWCDRPRRSHLGPRADQLEHRSGSLASRPPAARPYHRRWLAGFECSTGHQADISLRRCYSSAAEEQLLILVITSLVFAATAFAVVLPYGAAPALLAAVVCGAVSIMLAGAWLAF